MKEKNKYQRHNESRHEHHQADHHHEHSHEETMKHDHGAVYKAPDGLEFTHQPVLEETMSGNVYQCPMKCEGDKTYNAPGNCPVCKMKLALVSDTNSHGHQQSKETNHNH